MYLYEAEFVYFSQSDAEAHRITTCLEHVDIKEICRNVKQCRSPPPCVSVWKI